MDEGNLDPVSPIRSGGESSSSSTYRDIFFSTEQDLPIAEKAGNEASRYASTSSATISLFSSGSESLSEDIESPDQVPDPSLGGRSPNGVSPNETVKVDHHGIASNTSNLEMSPSDLSQVMLFL